MAIERVADRSKQVSFDALPLDLIPLILEHLRYRVVDLSACCLTSKLFNELSTPLLYQRLWLRDQRRLQRVFRTLAHSPKLCQLVHIIELRVFPFGLTSELLEALETAIEHTFRHAIHLQELVWTRTGSLNDRLIPFLFTSSPQLTRVEITGDARTWSTQALLRYIQPTVQDLSIILPERSVVNALIDVAAKIAQPSNEGRTGLRSLSLLCQHSPLVKDAHLQALAPHLYHLHKLSLAGCRAVTGRGVQAVLRSASQCSQGITELAMEGLDIQGKDLQLILPYVAQLTSLSLTYPRSASSSGSRSLPASALHDFYRHFADLVERADSLTELTHYAGAGSRPALDGRDDDLGDEGFVDLDDLGLTDDNDDDDDEDSHAHYDAYGNTTATTNPDVGSQTSVEELVRRFSGPPPTSIRYGHRQISAPPANLPLLSTHFLSRLIVSRGQHLTKLRLHGIGMSLDQLQLIVQSCVALRDLVIQIWEDDLSRLAALLCQLPQLETLHLLASASSETALGEEEIGWIAQMCADANRHRRLFHHANRTALQRPTLGHGLRQIGFRNRVWLTEHTSTTMKRPDNYNHRNDEDGQRDEPETMMLVTLKRWDPSAGSFPEVLLVVRS